MLLRHNSIRRGNDIRNPKNVLNKLHTTRCQNFKNIAGNSVISNDMNRQMLFKLTGSVIFAKKRWTTKSLNAFICSLDLLLFSLTNRLDDNEYQQWSHLIKLWLLRWYKCTCQNKNWWMKGRYVGCFQLDKEGGCICDITWFTLHHSHSMVRFRHINYPVGFGKKSLLSV